MFNHLLLTLPPPVTKAQARRVDAIAVKCAQVVLQLQHVHPGTDTQLNLKARLFLPRDGMGMQSCIEVVDTAYIGRWVGPTVQKMLPRTTLVSQESCK
jgi:hypothetical protein